MSLLETVTLLHVPLVMVTLLHVGVAPLATGGMLKPSTITGSEPVWRDSIAGVPDSGQRRSNTPGPLCLRREKAARSDCPAKPEFHSRSVSSQLPVSTFVPSGEKATELILFACPLI